MSKEIFVSVGGLAVLIKIPADADFSKDFDIPIRQNPAVFHLRAHDSDLSRCGQKTTEFDQSAFGTLCPECKKYVDALVLRETGRLDEAAAEELKLKAEEK